LKLFFRRDAEGLPKKLKFTTIIYKNRKMKRSYSLLIGLLLFFIIIPETQAQKTATKAVPVFKDGEAQIVPGFSDPDKWIRTDLWVETDFDTDGDGKSDRMHVDVTRPPQTETEGLKLPVIYVSSPYFAGVAPDVEGLNWDVNHELGEPAPHGRAHPEVTRRGKRPIISNSHTKTWVPHGYIVVHSSSPGTGLSDGSPTVGGENESLAPKAVIEWLCGRRPGYKSRTGNEKVKAYWSTGKVGMTGTSYNGTLPLAAATTGVDGLEAIIPIAPNTSYYHYYRSNGLVRSPGGYLGEDVDVLYDFIHSGDESKRAYSNRVIRDTEMKNGMDRITGDYNDFWAGRDYLNHMKPMKAALFMSHGFNDWNVMPEHSYRIYKAAKEKGLPVMIYYHQNGHGGPPPLSMMNRWFTCYLFGIENGVENDPKAWIVRENDKRDQPTPYADYPNPEAAPVELFLKPGAPEAGKLCLYKKGSTGKEKLVDNYSFSGSVLAQADNTDHRLIYVTPKLKKDVHISGIPKITIKLASSKPAANLSVWMVSLPWNENSSRRKAKITDNIINRGWADPQNYKSIRKGEPLKPGRFYEVSFDLMPDDQIIPAGQQIALMIFSSDKEFTIHPKPGTELTIDLEGTKLVLPVVGGKAAFEKAVK
jgi:X-Pro dipeptidyl-peptidase